MPWPRRHLAPDEAVLVAARRHWSGLAGPVVVAAASTAGGVALAAGASGTPPRAADVAAGAVVGLAAVWLVARYLRWARVPLVLTDRRLLLRRAALRRPAEVALADVVDVQVRRTRRQRIVGAADVHVDALGAAPVVAAGLTDVDGLVRQLVRRVEAERRRWPAPPPIDLDGPRRRLGRRPLARR